MLRAWKLAGLRALARPLPTRPSISSSGFRNLCGLEMGGRFGRFTEALAHFRGQQMRLRVPRPHTQRFMQKIESARESVLFEKHAPHLPVRFKIIGLLFQSRRERSHSVIGAP